MSLYLVNCNIESSVLSTALLAIYKRYSELKVWVRLIREMPRIDVIEKVNKAFYLMGEGFQGNQSEKMCYTILNYK